MDFSSRIASPRPPIGTLTDALHPQIQDNSADSQYGGMAGGGTDYPNHTVRSALQYARLFSLSVFVLSLDLEKAFDKVIREVVMGWPHCDDGSFGPEERQLEYLRSIGVSTLTSEHIVGLVRNEGTVFHRWQVDPKSKLLSAVFTPR